MKKTKKPDKNLEQEKLKKQKHEEILNISLAISLLLCLLLFIFWSLTDEPDTQDYYVSHYYLFILNIMIFLGLLFQPGAAKLMINSFKRLIKSPKNLARNDIAYSIFLGVNIIASISFIIIDFTFMQNISLRVPTVVAINLFGILKSYFRKK